MLKFSEAEVLSTKYCGQAQGSTALGKDKISALVYTEEAVQWIFTRIK